MIWPRATAFRNWPLVIHCRPTASARISGMITKPPPNDSAPTLNATQATETSTPPPATAAAARTSAGSAAIPRTFPAAEPSEPASRQQPSAVRARRAVSGRRACPVGRSPGRATRACPMASSVTPQPSRTSTSHGPMVAAAAPPASR